MPTELQPELATLVTHHPATPEDWVFEVKFDGYRMLARVAGEDVKLISRNAKEWTDKLLPLRDELRRMKLPDGWYDGEIVAIDAAGKPDFGLLQNSFDRHKTQDITYYIFDAPFLDGVDMREQPLLKRRAALEKVLSDRSSDKVSFSASLDADPGEMVNAACQMGLEGLIGKRKDSRYVPRRSSDWIKLKCGQRQEFVVGGFTEPGGARVGIGALLLGTYDSNGKLVYAGSVGTGFDDKTLRDLYKRLAPRKAKTSPFAPHKELAKRAIWVRPELVVEVAFAEWTHTHSIRHATYRGLRTDKEPASVTREHVVGVAVSSVPVEPVKASGLKVTNGDRIVDPVSGVTKLQLVDYYASISDLMSSHLINRPVSLVRAPAGIAGELFFQKHAESAKLDGVKRFPVSINPNHPPMLELPNSTALVSTAQWNVIEYHTQNAFGTRYEQPNRMIFDLDPGEGVGWAEIQEAAELVKGMLLHLGLTPFLKTSGGKGLHLDVPIEPRYGWDAVKNLSKAIVVHMTKILPDRFAAKSGPANRKRKIFIDYLRNGRGATTACAWSARARPGMGISVPVAWDELPRLTGGNMWSVHSAPERVAVGNEPWQDYVASTCSINEALDMLDLRRRR